MLIYDEFVNCCACSCEAGILRSAVGMLGKVWSSGSLAVVQNLSIIPTSVHPRSKLHGALPAWKHLLQFPVTMT